GISTHASEKRRIDIGSNTGTGEENTFTINPYLQYTQELSRHFSVSGKVTATYANGFLGNSFGIGDFYGIATYKANDDDATNNLRILAGIKIPFTSSNQKNNAGGALPLDYQSSLGTYDAILGINYILHRHWEFNAGVQVPVIQNNKNTFFPHEYSDKRAESFAPTNFFRRKSDVLLRSGYYFNTGKGFTIKPGVLAIYHVGNDTYEDQFGKRASINGSKGLTLNGTIMASKQFKNKTSLELIAATPFIVRDVRADGLTRSFVANVQYSISID
ncbi:MAG: hypothetical protein DI539_27695, partial [Flavobacterium psychrophilum]